MRSRELLRLIRSAALVAVLLLAQAAVAAHIDLEDSHPAGDVCALCAAHSVLGSGNVGFVAACDLVSPDVLSSAPEQSSEPLAHRSYFLARGPPAAS